jgi:dienelactone hydrolase
MAISQHNVEARSVQVSAGPVALEGDLTVPVDARGVVLFAHGSGSSRLSSRNRLVAAELNAGGLATLLMDLLSPQEERIEQHTGHLRFDIPLLAGRLVAAIDWLASDDQTAGLPVGVFGASTGGGAALVAAAERPLVVGAVVSRGGRPDLAEGSLAQVRAPTLLIVGGEDDVVIDFNRPAMRPMRCGVGLEIIPGAGHLFEEPGALGRVAELARDWFTSRLGQSPSTRRRSSK